MLYSWIIDDKGIVDGIFQEEGKEALPPLLAWIMPKAQVEVKGSRIS